MRVQMKDETLEKLRKVANRYQYEFHLYWKQDFGRRGNYLGIDSFISNLADVLLDPNVHLVREEPEKKVH